MQPTCCYDSLLRSLYPDETDGCQAIQIKCPSPAYAPMVAYRACSQGAWNAGSFLTYRCGGKTGHSALQNCFVVSEQDRLHTACPVPGIVDRFTSTYNMPVHQKTAEHSHCLRDKLAETYCIAVHSYCEAKDGPYKRP